MEISEIEETFAFFDDWEDKYRFVIELGRELPVMEQADRIEHNLVRGCQSQVWMVARYDADANTLHFDIDSDAHIVRGLIAIVLSVYDGRSPGFVRDFDIEALFEKLDLLKHLSPTRGNGLRAMIAKIRAFAATCTA